MDELIKQLESQTKSLLDSLKQVFGGIRANRPSPQLVENIQVLYLDQQFAVKQLGSISIVPPRELQISVWDKGAVSAVAKAIQDSSLHLMPSVQGNIVRVQLPTLTTERRDELTKVVKSETEKIRIKLRGLRDEANKKIEAALKAKTISEDQKFKTKERIQKAVDKANEEIEGLLQGKIREISE